MSLNIVAPISGQFYRDMAGLIQKIIKISSFIPSTLKAPSIFSHIQVQIQMLGPVNFM